VFKRSQTRYRIPTINEKKIKEILSFSMIQHIVRFFSEFDSKLQRIVSIGGISNGKSRKDGKNLNGGKYPHQLLNSFCKCVEFPKKYTFH
jgi:hypothetical protein